MTNNLEAVKEGIEVVLRAYNDLNEEKNLNVTKLKFKFLGQVLNEIERNVNEIRLECDCNERSPRPS
jgi:hypothetical protein